MLRLNTMLVNVGFKNITHDFGPGKTNAKWEKGKYLFIRKKVFDKVFVVVYCNALKIAEYKLPEDEETLREFIKNGRW